ncbi:MAG: hypothetical protein J6I31_08510, partial [Prevotella sp.]|nr:hypothetical protein [Prevotella sp.]
METQREMSDFFLLKSIRSFVKHPRARKLNKVYIYSCLDRNQVCDFFSHLNEKKLQKSLAVRKIVVPLHPLSGDSPSG